MFDQLDTALSKLLDEPRLQSLLPALFDAETSFLTPGKGYAPAKDAVNLFLYETRENRDLREALPSTRIQQGVGVRRRAPLRVDCSYMVTTWAGKTGLDKVAAEHRLLGQAFQWLSRFAVIPANYLPSAMRTAQDFAPPTLVAQMEGAESAGDFWHALGIAPRPYFNLTVTLAMDLDRSVEDGIVTTIISRYQSGDAPSAEERLIIGGTVRDRNGNPVPDAWVLLEPTATVVVTDAAGRFVFDRAPRGSGYTLRARASGHPEINRPDLELPSLSGEYDLAFP